MNMFMQPPRALFLGDIVDGISDFFSGIFSPIFDFFDTILSFLWDVITSLLNLVVMIPQAITALTKAIDSLPDMLVVFATATVTISVVLIIVGRNGGGD